MSFRHGKNAEISIAGTLLGAYCDSLDISIDVDTADTTTYAAAWKTAIPGAAGGGIEFGGNYDPVAAVGPQVILEPLIGAAAFAVIAYPGGNVAGQRKWTFDAILTSYKESSPVGGKVTFKASLLPTGTMTPATI